MYRIRRFLILACLCLSGMQPLRAQLDSLVYGVSPLRIAPERKGELRATIDMMPFMQDLEYDTELMKGYTLPGVWVEPRVSYQPLRNLNLELGAYMLHYWGATRYPATHYGGLPSWQVGAETQRAFHALPVIRAHMQLTPSLHIILGSLYGKAAHGLYEPLYDRQLNLCGDPESGVQVRLDTRPVWLDAWVDWQSFIFNDDTGQEAFTFGLSTRFRPSRRTARWQWYLPVQAIFRHQGGEVNTAATDRTVKTWLNAAAGVGVDIPLRARFDASLNVEAAVMGYSQQKSEEFDFTRGYGFYGRATARLWRFRVGLSYWRCDRFVTLMGSSLYGVLSASDEGTSYDRPHMLSLHTEYAQALGAGFSWGIETDVYKHLPATVTTGRLGSYRDTGGISLAAGIYLRACPSFLIHRFGGGSGGR